MAGISSIVRDWGDNPDIVRIQSSDLLSLVGSPNYILNQAASIAAANNGAFSWQASDVVLVSASDGWGFFSISSDLSSLNPVGGNVSQVEIPLSAAQVKAMYDAPVLVLHAPAAGTVNMVRAAWLSIDFNSAQYQNGGAIALQYEGTVHGGGVAATGTIAAATLNAVAADEVLVFPLISSLLLANAVAQPLYISNASGDFTNGDSPAKLYVSYSNIAV